MIMMKPRHAIMLGLTWAFVSASPLSFATADPAAPAPAAATPKVLATVNGKKITEEDLKIAMEDLGSSVPQQLQGKARETYLLDYLVDSQLVVQQAMAQKLDQTPDFTEKLTYMHDKALMEIMLSDVAKAATTDEMLHKTYDDAAKAQKPETEVHARHILVPTEAEAQAALKRVKAGEDFAKVAKEVSKDPSAEGGDLGWFTKDRMVPEFAEAAFKLEPGQISDPVKSQFGWHIIKLEGKRQKSFPPFDEVRDQIVRYVVQKAQSELIVKLRDSAKIERAEVETPPGDVAAPPAGSEPPAPKPANPAGK
jgi:peptidyl-prolyl cis-trans isomerase C